MHIACWITKATNTLREGSTFRFSLATKVTRKPLNVTLIEFVGLTTLPPSCADYVEI